MVGFAKDPQTNDGVQALPFPDTIQNVTYTDTAGQSNAFGTNVTLLTLCSDTDCFYLIGADPTATTSNGQRLPANTPWVARVNAGEKISAIRATADDDGSLNIGEHAFGT